MSCLKNFKTPLGATRQTSNIFLLEPLYASVLDSYFLKHTLSLPICRGCHPHILANLTLSCHCLNIYSTPICNCGLCRDFFICSSQIRVGVRVNICCYNYQFQSVCCITPRCSIPASSNLKFSRLHVYRINFNTLHNR